mmetsp:Transcript_22750/g.29147  ORF Transcript_22750/g.29147 Transcript_22750/m.29147 type:complete len:192 (+) Transcript_22750:275-850(+)|eukprot:CAMPEP_0116051768 /NCGR_PEP_ID=MMETSP0322-20121206/1174_1 /TAXON_ID=163516 /ORGANISM="Leptocylindrus danicus var. apora, Strain B651" /LENGTH=191 /DNA_ID=CAMNT_0003534575 /DNA_START=476 /DNA_END=1051 /DNA_ORIENTATION=-
MNHTNMRWCRLMLVAFSLLLASMVTVTEAFTLQMMGRRKGNLKKQLNDSKGVKSARSMNQGKGQLLTGVSFPEEMKVKGWEFGEDTRMACARVEGKLYAIEGTCPRCAFDLYKGTIDNTGAFGDDPVLACPTCSTTYNLRTGKCGPPYKRTGLAGFVGKLTQTATATEANIDAKCYILTKDDEGQVYIRPK